ncbi:MAG: ergothioneine biosynthesis protein EgtB [Gammaproteobacteria bacterium]|nr:ergothioneine biosynthesis protein EgtB [Gammaproteobacteria bacterium]NNM14430.1 ergothioneine biosynthesis protein EgtB [Gammaproteobacteria bacterium]
MPETAIARYRDVRRLTEDLVANLSDADMTAQSMPDASPAKWHLAHSTWFFETFILARFAKDYEIYDEQFGFLFNSYYESAGPRHSRSQRGLITRPSKDEVLAYRTYVDEAMMILLDTQFGSNDELAFLLELGINHEQQHQELLHTDILHLFAQNPLRPAFDSDLKSSVDSSAKQWLAFDESLELIGHSDDSFAYDNEMPQHKVFVGAFEIASNLVTNSDWLEFMQDGGYAKPMLWLSDAWAMVQSENWQHPLYWEQKDGEWFEFGLNGLRPIDPDAPVKHISYFEADAFACWKQCRLPSEFEWEVAVTSQQLSNAFGEVWQWTRSPYVGYPGFKIATGAVGEYNGKFMCNQFVLRGSSVVTSAGHERVTYRNFFYPQQRWQFTGLRLARDI